MMQSKRPWFRAPAAAASLFAATLGLHSVAGPAGATDCGYIIGLLERGIPEGEIVQATGVSMQEIFHCVEISRQQQVQPAPGFGVAERVVGPLPRTAAGRPPTGAAGPAPVGAAGPPPLGAAGPPPLGAAGPPTSGAAGPAPR